MTLESEKFIIPDKASKYIGFKGAPKVHDFLTDQGFEILAILHNEAKDNASDMYFSSIRNIFHLENVVQFKSQNDLPVLLLHKSLNINQTMPGVELIRNKHLAEIEIKQLGVVF